MKNLSFIPFLFSILTLTAQQSSVSGIVSIHNSQFETGKRLFVPNAEIKDAFDKANPTTTDANGGFKLTFVGVLEKANVTFMVKKEGLEVVNLDALNAVAGQRDKILLSMASPNKMAEYRKQIYKVGRTEAEKNLLARFKKTETQLAELQKNVTLNAVQIQKLQAEYADLEDKSKKIDEQAQELARKYAPINLDDATPLYQEAFRAFQSGDFEKALDILRGANLEKQSKDILAEKKRNDAARVS